MKQVLLAILTCIGLFIWLTFPPSEGHTQSFVQPSFGATHIDSITALKSDIDLTIAKTEVELLAVVVKLK